MQSLKLLSNTSSWYDLNKKLEELTKSGQAKFAGDIFENVCKYFLQTAPQYQTKLKNVLLLKEVKEDLRGKLNLPSTDEGIDLIAETFDGKYWAIQSKYRSDTKDTLTIKGDLATFANLAFNNCKNISLGLVMTTADKPPLKTKLLKGVSFVTLESFLELDDNKFEGWNLIKAKANHKTIIPKALSPRPHQVKAIKDTVEYFKTKERGKVIMPCGTGKSLTAFWIANRLKAKSVLIAVPSLALLQQTLKVWTREYLIAGIKPDWLCVCSDQTVSDDQDDFVSNIYELGIDVTTDKNEIKKFLKSKANTKIVFTTYQSGKVTAQGAKGFTFDLGIMDEAHKTVGLGSKPMAHLIHQKNIKIKHRLFMTATERLFRGDKEEYLSMDDPRDYGDLIYQLSFKEAIEANPPIISDYKIITFGISEPEIEAVYQDNKFIQIKKEIDDIKAREFATALALRKAIKKLGIRNAISFHSSIRRANNFKAQQELISKVYPEYGNLKAFHVSGDMPTNQRSSQMREFAESKGLMTNARCLTEGVDLPAIDCVVFTDPKKSKVDIVQAAGRALRLSPGKKFGYILIPLIIPENENATEAAKDTAFEEIVATIRALATQDTRIIEYLRAVSSGTIPKGGSPVDGITKINVLTKVNEEEFNKSIQLKVWDRVAFGNYKNLMQAKKYVKTLNIKSENEYHDLYKKKKLPIDLPYDPYSFYHNDPNWISIGDFLGSGFIAYGKRNYRKYDQAKKYVIKLKIKNFNKYLEYLKNNKLPNDIPSSPQYVYKNSGWKGWGDYLGSGTISFRNIKYFSYEQARVFLEKRNIKTIEELRKFLKSPDRPQALTSVPHIKYKDKWLGYWHYLKNSKLRKSSKYVKMVTFTEAKNFAKKNNITTLREWRDLYRQGKLPPNIPLRMNEFYNGKGFRNFPHFFGTNRWSKDTKMKNFTEAKKFFRSLKLSSGNEWFKKIKNNKNFKPSNIPMDPSVYYKKKGFVSWKDLLGNSYDIRISRSNIHAHLQNAPSYHKAKKIIKNFNFKNKTEYFKKFKELKKYNLPRNASSFYTIRSQWKNWPDFLGTSRKPRSRKS